MDRKQAIVMKAIDNVATAIADIEAGSTVYLTLEADGCSIKICQSIPFGHKFAAAGIPKGSPVIKYGEIIGAATRDIQVGEHVHVHNVESIRGRGDKV